MASPRRAASEPAPEPAGPGNYAVTDGNAVVRLLDQLQQCHALLSAHLPGEAESYGTTVLGVYPDQDFFVLDELNPATGHEKLLERRTLTVVGRLDGIAIRFNTQVLESGSREGVAFYKAAFPLQVQYLQRRNRHRISLVGAPIAFTAACGRDPARTALSGTVHDICADGLGLLVGGDPVLHRGDVLTACTFRLAREGEFRVDLEVRHATRVADRRITRVGTRMLDTEQPTQRRLEAAIARLERELARRSRPD